MLSNKYNEISIDRTECHKNCKDRHRDVVYHSLYENVSTFVLRPVHTDQFSLAQFCRGDEKGPLGR